MLVNAGFRSTGLSLRVYALEIRLKWVICKHLDLDLLPAACKTHNLGDLLVFTGLFRELDDPDRDALRQSWDLLAEFSKTRLNGIRYSPRADLTLSESDQLIAALDDPGNGVLAWLSRHL